MKKLLAGLGDCVPLHAIDAIGTTLVAFGVTAALVACGESKPAEEPASVMSTEPPPPVIVVAAPAPTVAPAPTATTMVAPGTTVTQSTTTTTVAH